MKYSFPVEVEEHLRKFVRDDQGRQIRSITVKEIDAADEHAADVLIAKPQRAKPADLMAYGAKRAACLVGLCVTAYEVAGAVGEDGKEGPLVAVACKAPNEAWEKWSPKAKALATAFWGQINGADDSEIDPAFRKALAVP